MEKTDTAGATGNTTGVPSEMEAGMSLEEFIASGRTGRRNAMPDILDSNKAHVGTGDIAYDMEKLNCSDSNQAQSSQKASATASTSQGS